MHDWLTYRVGTTPEATALVRAETGAEWTFAELDEAVERACGRLADLGVEAGDHVGMVLPNRVASVVVLHATVRLGATLVPTSPRLTARELGEQLERADVTVLVCDAETEQVTVEAANDVPVVTVDDPHWEEVTSLSAADRADFDPVEWTLQDTMLILFTSGTTGAPKAVELTVGNVLFNAVASTFRLGLLPSDRWLVTLALHHMGGIGPLVRSPLYGTEVVLRNGFDAGGVVDDIDRYEVTGVSLVPTMLTRMLDSRGMLSDSLRVVLLGGAPAPDELIQRCRNFSVPVYPTYGMTETASQIATATPTEAFETVGTVGRPLFWTDLRVVDEDGVELGPGEVGEFVVSGPTVSPGYYRDEAATDEAYDVHGFHTGDVGYKDAKGRLFVLNRKDDRIVTGGENVDPGEVVSVLRESPLVDDAAVVGVPDDEWGQRVGAMVVLTGPENVSDVDDDPDLEALESFCRDRLAGFKLPRVWAVVDELPRTESGTVAREAVAERLHEEVHVEVPDAERESVEASATTAEEGTTAGEGTAVTDSAAGDEGSTAVEAGSRAGGDAGPTGTPDADGDGDDHEE